MSVQMLVKEASAEYTMLSASDHWGPHGKTDNGAALEGLSTKAELNTLVQKQVSATLKQMSNGDNKSSDSQKPNQCDQNDTQDDKSKKP